VVIIACVAIGARLQLASAQQTAAASKDPATPVRPTNQSTTGQNSHHGTISVPTTVSERLQIRAETSCYMSADSSESAPLAGLVLVSRQDTLSLVTAMVIRSGEGIDHRGSRRSGNSSTCMPRKRSDAPTSRSTQITSTMLAMRLRKDRRGSKRTSRGDRAAPQTCPQGRRSEVAPTSFSPRRGWIALQPWLIDRTRTERTEPSRRGIRARSCALENWFTSEAVAQPSSRRRVTETYSLRPSAWSAARSRARPACRPRHRADPLASPYV